MVNIAVLVSGGGTNLQALIDAAERDEIKNGKLGRAIKSTTISGVAFEMLKTVTMVSDDLTWTSCGMCGKKQPIPVSMGGPAIKCRLNVGGR